MRCTPFYGADRRPTGYACGRGQTKPRPCTFCRIACQLLCDGPGCDVPVCGACARSVRSLDKDFCPKCIATVVDGCAAAAFVPQVKCVGPQCEKSADGSPVCVAHSLVFTTFLRPLSSVGFKRPPFEPATRARGSARASASAPCGYPLPHLDELVPERALRRYVDERLRLKDDTLDGYVAEVGKELREFRAELARVTRLVESMEQAGAAWPGGVPPTGVKLVTVIVEFATGDRMALAMRPGPKGLDLDCTKMAKPDSVVLVRRDVEVGTIKLRVAGEWVRQ